MGQAFLRGQGGGGTRVYTLGDCTVFTYPEGLELVLPSGVTWGQIETMMIGGLNSEYLPNYYKKDPGGTSLYESTGGTTTPASSATALSALNLYNADIVIIVLK